MPTYNFRVKSTDQFFQEFMTISDMEELLKTNSDIEIVPSMPGIISGYHQKPDQGFRQLLKQIKANNPRSTVNTW